MIDIQLQKAQLLFGQDKWQEASKILKDLMAQAPNDLNVIAAYAQVLIHEEKEREAITLLDTGIGIAPDVDLLFYLKSKAFAAIGRFKEAEKEINQAIDLDPKDAENFAWLALIKLNLKEFNSGLAFANQALSLDPENLLALNMRSSLQTKLNDGQGAAQTIEKALEKDPNNPYTHASYGWTLLEQGKTDDALKHFKESLSIDPNYEMAQAGMLEAIKGKYWIYKMYLKYVFWMSNKTKENQWIFIIGFYVIYRILNSISKNSPDLSVYIQPLLFILAFFAISTWVLAPLSNLFLRFNKYGKHLLDKEERISSNFVGIAFFCFLIGVIAYFATGLAGFLALTVYGFTMMIPLSSMFQNTNPRQILLLFSVLLGGLGAFIVFNAFIKNSIDGQLPFFYLIGFVAFQWGANLLMTNKINR